MLWLNGKYVADAIMSSIGNSGWFKGKGAPLNEYLKEPYPFNESKFLTEEEKQREVDKFFAQESARRANWKRTHKNNIPFLTLSCYTQYKGVGNMKCIECKKNIGVLDDKCPYCGAVQYDDEPTVSVSYEFGSENKAKEPMFSEEECLVYGIHPDDEMYRKTMELNVLSKNYK